MPNPILSRAIRNKKDEFYTPYSVIENEVMTHEQEFYGKTVLCNCNDSVESNFYKFFVKNFNNLKLRRLICVAYGNSLVDGDDEQPYILDINRIDDLSHIFDSSENHLIFILKNGEKASYDSSVLQPYVDESDIIITNPPFSLFKEYFIWLIGLNKKFCVLGNLNAVCYKQFFPYFMNGVFHLGISLRGGSVYCRFPKGYDVDPEAIVRKVDGNETIGIPNVRWFTNLHNAEPPFLHLKNAYIPEKYPKFDNYDAINVDKTKLIPFDYKEVMGVPLTFLDKWNSEQFELLGCSKKWLHDKVPTTHNVIGNDCALVHGKTKYVRLFIKNRIL